MPILDAALAFALTMLVVATVVTQILRVIQNALGLRKAEMSKMLSEYLEKEVGPVVEREAIRIGGDLTGSAAESLVRRADRMAVTDLFKGVGEEEIKDLIEVPVEDLVERLKRSDLGRELYMEYKEKAQDVFDELRGRYESLEVKFTKSFRKSSRYWATFVAFVLAALLNIDSVFIADSYIKNESVRNGVVEKMDAIVDRYESAIVVVSDPEDPGSKEALEEAVQASREQIGYLGAIGFPIGHSYFPWNGSSGESSPVADRRGSGWDWVIWILGIILTSLLAGLGAPFWYDTVLGISKAAQKARAGRGG